MACSMPSILAIRKILQGLWHGARREWPIYVIEIAKSAASSEACADRGTAAAPVKRASYRAIQSRALAEN